MADLNVENKGIETGLPPFQGSDFGRTPEHLDAGAQELPKTETAQENPQSQKLRAVDEAFVMDPKIKQAALEMGRQSASRGGELPKEMQAQLLTDILNKNHRKELDAADMNDLAMGNDVQQIEQIM